MLSQGSLKAFRESLRGASFCPEDVGYDAARTIPNAMINRRPAVIARCAGAADVVDCVRFAREHSLIISVRGGGHSVAGKSVCDGGVMVDLSAMKGIRVDPKRHTARAQAGLTLGGGFGNLLAKHGLALDNLISVDVVTADGRLLTVNADENEDLFWGVRGGGGNLGIVTSLEYRLHEVGPVLGGAVLYPVTQTKDVLHFCRDFAQRIPDDLMIQGGAFTSPDGVPVFAVAACYSGATLSAGEKLLQPLRNFGPPIADMIATMSHLQMQSFFEPYFPPGRHTYVKSNFLRALSDDAIATIARWAGTSPSATTFAPFFEHWHGAVGRVGVSETAFPHRQHEWNLFAWSTWTDPADTEKNVQWTRQCWESLRPFLVDGSYVNYVSDEGDVSARASYGPNYDRLVALKNKYDPTNLFRMNHNIRPTV